MKIMENVYLKCPLTLGSYFVCNAIVRHYLEMSHSVTLPVLPHFMDTVKCLYSDVNNIQLVLYLGQHMENKIINEQNLPVVDFRSVIEVTQMPLIGHEKMVNVLVNWDRQVYEHFDWCYSKRYQLFQMPSQVPGSQELYKKLNPDNEPFVLLHKHTSHHVAGVHLDLAAWRPSAGLNPPLKIIEVQMGQTSNLLDYVDLIRKATEIHVIPGSVHCLVDSMVDQTPARLFFHDIRANRVLLPNSRFNQWRWHMVHYGVKQ